MADRSAARMVGVALIVMAEMYDKAMAMEDLIVADALHLTAQQFVANREIREKDFSWDQMGEDAEAAALKLRAAQERLFSEIEPTPPGQTPWYDPEDTTLVYYGDPKWRG